MFCVLRTALKLLKLREVDDLVHFLVVCSLFHNTYTYSLIKEGGRDGAVVRALASHQCGSGSIPRFGVICGLSLWVLYYAPRGFLRVVQFPLYSKTNI